MRAEICLWLQKIILIQVKLGSIVLLSSTKVEKESNQEISPADWLVTDQVPKILFWVNWNQPKKWA